MSAYEKQEMEKASFKTLIKWAVQRHQKETRCSAQEAREWIEGEIRVVNGSEAPSEDRLISIDNSIANLLANVAMDRGFTPGEAKFIVRKRVPKHWDWFFKTLVVQSEASPNGVVQIGNLTFEKTEK